ncbi:MAG: four helix bundle protein [Chloroflexi bacterium]|nr:four helix bundle protein [Chloroflexota bacterium]
MEKLDERTYKFALRVIKMVNALPNTKTSDVLGHQVLRSATSIGANVEEALGAISKREFIQKMSIAVKEARETHYWLRLIRDAGILSADQLNPLIQEALEIKMILSKT